MELKGRINAFAKLGEVLDQLNKDKLQNENFKDWEKVINLANSHNGWFTPENILFSLQNWGKALSKENLEEWVSKYDLASESEKESKTIAIVMAGNVPLVGFHDFLTVLISGNMVLAKLSSNDKVLLPFLAEKLMAIEPDFKNYIEFTEGKLVNFDAVIATGSNNTSRYFDYYFGKYPHIIRKNRNSVAVLAGSESEEELRLLADDIFWYFGLGCRNVSKLYVPEGYDFSGFFQAIFHWKDIINNNKYINNYDYNKAVYLMDSLPLLDNEFLLLKEDTGFSSPIGVVFYETYSSLSHLKNMLEESSENLQCIVSGIESIGDVSLGNTQSPGLSDYADGVDTMEFLLQLN